MNDFQSLMNGFAACLTPFNLWMATLGCFLGTIVGVLPGLGPAATIAILIPLTYGMNPTPAMIMLTCIYYGSKYGGSTTSILVNLPGEAASVVTCFRWVPIGPSGAGGVRVRDIRHRIVRRRHPGVRRIDFCRGAACKIQLEIWPGRILQPDHHGNADHRFCRGKVDQEVDHERAPRSGIGYGGYGRRRGRSPVCVWDYCIAGRGLLHSGGHGFIRHRRGLAFRRRTPENKEPQGEV